MWIFAKIFVGAIYGLLYRFRVVGLDNVPRDGAVILCSNHRSLHDTIVLGLTSYFRKPHFVAKHQLFKNKLFGRILLSLGAIPINRDNPELKSLKSAISVLKGGGALAIFMQGGRRKTIEHEDAKAGVALFAIKGQAPVIPCYVNSTFKLFSKVHIKFGKPISFEEYYSKKVRTNELNEIAQRVMDEIINLEESI